MTRIDLKDSTMDAVAKMSGGNFGAMEALIRTLQEGEKIDPDDVMSGLGSILMLDTLGIYGTDIYVLYSDICNKDLAKTIAVIRSVQLGFFKSPLLKEACSRQDYSGRNIVPVDELYLKVKSVQPNFDLQDGVLHNGR